jgi:STE24 endopeptidase
LSDPAPSTSGPLRNTPGLRAALAAGGVVYLVLFAVSTFTRSAQMEAAAAAYFSPQEVEQALRLAFQRRLFFWSSTVLQLLFLGFVVFSGFARRLADFCDRVVPAPRPSAGQARRRKYRLLAVLHSLGVVLLVGGFCFLAVELLVLPIHLGSLANNRAWGLTERGWFDWLKDYSLALLVTAVLGALVLSGLYLLIRAFPRSWWLLGAAGSIALGFFYALILPVVINPLFTNFRPLKDPHLLGRARTLAERAGVPVQGVLIAETRRQGRYVNAYFTGFGPTRRIVVFETLLRPIYTPGPEAVASLVGLAGRPHPAGLAAVLVAHRTVALDEVESILAHEIGHWQHDHILKGILLAGLGGAVGLYLAARLLRAAVGRAPFALRSPSDPAGVPLLLLLSVLGTWVAAPVENLISRHFERQADEAALELARRPAAFIGAEKRLARTNLSNLAPTPFSVWLFASHPPTVERIRMAEEWRKRQEEASRP